MYILHIQNQNSRDVPGAGLDAWNLREFETSNSATPWWTSIQMYESMEAILIQPTIFHSINP